MDKVDGSGSGSVLLSFRAENVRSFRGEFELTLLATSLAEREVVREVPWRSGGRMIGVLPAAGIFGANGSGKSNVLKALDDMRSIVLHSFRLGPPGGGVVHRHPFLLDLAARKEPSRFEVDVILDGVRHGYGFTISDERVLDEWAVRYPHGKSALLFDRTSEKLTHGASNRTRGKAAEALLRPNALFLSTAASAGHPDLVPLYTWFESLLLADAQSRPFRQRETTQLLNDEAQRSQVLALLQAADLGITGAKQQELDPVLQERVHRAVRIIAGREDEPDSSNAETVSFEAIGTQLIHRGAAGDVDMAAQDESLGTLVWFGLIGPVVQALAKGTVLLADELDASLHPALVAQLVRLFQDPGTNPRNAQLIFNSHDVTLMGNSAGERLIGRDQIWFTEKYADGSTRLYPLADLDPRKEEAIARRYLAGRYGAVPILSSQDFAVATEAATVKRWV